MSTKPPTTPSAQEEVSQEVTMMIEDLKRPLDMWTETLHQDLRALAEAVEAASAKVDSVGIRQFR